MPACSVASITSAETSCPTCPRASRSASVVRWRRPTANRRTRRPSPGWVRFLERDFVLLKPLPITKIVIKADQAAGKMPKCPLVKADFVKRRQYGAPDDEEIARIVDTYNSRQVEL